MLAQQYLAQGQMRKHSLRFRDMDQIPEYQAVVAANACPTKWGTALCARLLGFCGGAGCPKASLGDALLVLILDYYTAAIVVCRMSYVKPFWGRTKKAFG